MYNTMDIKDGQELIIDNKRFDIHRFKLGERVYVKFVINSHLLRVENEYGTEYDVHISNVKLSEENDKMENLIGKKVRINEKLYNSMNVSAYTKEGYSIGDVYEVIDSKFEHGTVVQLKNKDDNKKDYWIKLIHLDVLENDTEVTLIEFSNVLKKRQNEVLDEIKRLQSEAQVIAETLSYVDEMKKNVK